MIVKHIRIIFVVIFIFIQFFNCYEDELEIVGVFPSKKHSLLRPFQANGMTIPNWNFYRNTVVMSEYIRLTADKPGKRGGLWNTVPLESPYWEIHVLFKIHGSSKGFSGDGLAFWYTTTPIQEGDAFGAKSRFTGLSVMLDTYGNTLHKHSYPYISVMINNGSLVYDHDNDGTGVAYAGCEAKIRSVSSNSMDVPETVLLIRYDRDELIVKTDFESKNQWNDCLSLSGVKLPSHGYLGISASTGDLSDYHDIIWMRVHELDDDMDEDSPGDDERKISDSDPYAVNKRLFTGHKKIMKSKEKEDRRKIIPDITYGAPLVGGGSGIGEKDKNGLSNLSIFVIIFFTMLAFVFLAAVGYLYYQNQQEKNRKRFY